MVTQVDEDETKIRSQPACNRKPVASRAEQTVEDDDGRTFAHGFEMEFHGHGGPLADVRAARVTMAGCMQLYTT